MKKLAYLTVFIIVGAALVGTIDFTVVTHQPTWEYVVPVAPQASHNLPWTNNTSALDTAAATPAQDNTVHITIAAINGTQPYNINGTSWGRLVWYLPAYVNINLTFHDKMGIAHNIHIERVPARWHNQTKPVKWASLAPNGFTNVLETHPGQSTPTAMRSLRPYTSLTVHFNGTQLAPGLYILACGVPGHAEDGMYTWLWVGNYPTSHGQISPYGHFSTKNPVINHPWYEIYAKGKTSGTYGGSF